MGALDTRGRGVKRNKSDRDAFDPAYELLNVHMYLLFVAGSRGIRGAGLCMMGIG